MIGRTKMNKYIVNAFGLTATGFACKAGGGDVIL
mgnify:CR=1 FL=1|jgi:hypothetical protein